MASKPFSIQAPETIAKEYGGNKQKIAQAVQSGMVDPTAGVLAGMFIDRMRAAQTAEQVPAPSVAQQVFAPPAPPAPQMGLGAIPPSGAPPQMPAAAPQMAPAPGMAEGGYMPPYGSGGLGGLPLPDTMFDEPSNGGFNDGYAGGGMVAFAGGGSAYDDYYELRKKWDDAVTRKAIDEQGAIWGPMQAAKARMSAAPRGLGAITPAAPKAAAYTATDMTIPESPTAPDLAADVGTGKQRMGGHDASPERDELRKSFTDIMSPGAEGKAKDDAKWMALAQIGASLAASKSPYFLQAAGEAMQGAIPGVAAARKERKDDVRQALLARADMENMDSQEKRDYVKSGMDYHNQAKQLRMEGDKLKLQGKIAEAEEKYRKASLAQNYALTMAGVGAQYAAVNKPSALGEMVDLFKTNPAALKEILGLQHPGRDSTDAETQAERIRRNAGGSGGGSPWNMSYTD